MGYEEIAELCVQLSYRDKFRLAQLLIQLARKPTESGLGSIEYVADRLLKSKPRKITALLNFIGAMFQFQGGISDRDKEAIVSELQRTKWLSIDNTGRVSYRGLKQT